MKNIGNIIRIARPLYRLVCVLAVLIVVTAIFELIAPVLSKYIVDEIVARVRGTGGNINTLIFFISVAFCVSFASVILMVITERIGDHTAGRMNKFLTELFYQKILSLPQSHFDSELSGKMVNQLSRGISTIHGFLNTASNFIIPTFLQSIFTIFIMSYYNVWIGLFTFLLFPTYLIISYFSTKQWGKEEVKKNKIEDYSRGRIQEVISNIKLVKGFNNEPNEFSIISENLDKSNALYAKQSNAFHVYDFFRNLSLIVIMAIINIIAFYNTFRGWLTIGEMVLILQLLNQARRPLFAMSYILTEIQMAESGSKEFFEILALSSKEPFDREQKLELLKDPEIEFKNVHFKYETSEEVLKDVSFTLHSNEKIALVGHSGVGKSTIVNLILKLYGPSQGVVLMGKQNYKALNHRIIRHNIALVFQENELFSTTIRENVSYGSVASDEQIIEALKKANAYDFVMKLPQKLDSEVGERGVRLSGGQKQRIQVARAILKNAPILILDEATSSLDSKSEREVQEALENLMRDKLVIIIAHRFSTIQNVNTIIVLDEGKIVDQGSPKDLSTRSGIYADLLNYQIEGNKKLLAQFDIY